MLRAALQAGLLASVAGIADAVGFLTMGNVFAANMTGNTVLAGIAGAQRDWMQAWHHVAPLLAFFGGVLLSRLLLRLAHTPKVPVLMEAALLAGVGFLPIGPEASVLIVAVAMGVQASAITSFAGSAISTVVVTSTLARFAEAAFDHLWPGEPDSPPAILNRRLLILTWAAYLAGAVIGTLLVPAVAWPLLVPAGMLLLLLF